MGKRSRKRGGEGGLPVSRAGETRAERDAARNERARRAKAAGDPSPKTLKPRPGRTTAEDRPRALWAPFPLTELLTLAGIALMVWGFIKGAGQDGNSRIAAGLAIASIAGLELALREHVTGFRSHTTLLAGAVGILAIVGLGLGAGVKILGVLLAVGLVGFAAAFFGLRELFKRRSGGLSFR